MRWRSPLAELIALDAAVLALAFAAWAQVPDTHAFGPAVVAPLGLLHGLLGLQTLRAARSYSVGARRLVARITALVVALAPAMALVATLRGSSRTLVGVVCASLTIAAALYTWLKSPARPGVSGGTSRRTSGPVLRSTPPEPPP